MGVGGRWGPGVVGSRCGGDQRGGGGLGWQKSSL